MAASSFVRKFSRFEHFENSKGRKELEYDIFNERKILLCAHEDLIASPVNDIFLAPSLQELFLCNIIAAGLSDSSPPPPNVMQSLKTVFLNQTLF